MYTYTYATHVHTRTHMYTYATQVHKHSTHSYTSALMVRRKVSGCLNILTEIHGEVLGFKARFGHRAVFNTR